MDAFSLRSWSGEVSWVNCDWDDLDRVAQRLEAEPKAAATVLCPYFPAELAFQRLHRMCSGMVVMEWDPSWELRAEPNASGPLGPPEWNVAFVPIPARGLA